MSEDLDGWENWTDEDWDEYYYFPFDAKDKKNLKDEVYHLYETIRYKYFKHRMSDIFPSVETQLVEDEEDRNIQIKLTLRTDELNSMFETGELTKSKYYFDFLREGLVLTNVTELDQWIKQGEKGNKTKKKFFLFRNSIFISNDKELQISRSAFLRCFLESLKNVCQISAIAIPLLDEFERINDESGEEYLLNFCNQLVDNYQKEGMFNFIDKFEKSDLANWLFDAALSYIVGFELGLERAKGRFREKTGVEMSLDLDDIDEELEKMTTYELGALYEEECFHILEEGGYKVSATVASGDQGADLICEQEGLTFAIQCKNTDRVGNKAVQEVLAAMKYYQTDFAVVVTPGKFTKSALELAAPNDVVLINTEKLTDIYFIVR